MFLFNYHFALVLF